MIALIKILIRCDFIITFKCKRIFMDKVSDFLTSDVLNIHILSKSSSPLIVPSNKGKEVSQKDENLISPFLRTRRSIYPTQENLIDL
uniref:Uncharacterized protein n=1 Tax=Romanomermis culicivorax TaxID=13658 RepID=A0A915HJJ2_ROMCU